MEKSETPFLSATDLSQLIASKKVSPVEVVEAYLERIEQIDGKLNAYITVCADEAMAAAREAERAIARGHYLGPMHGLPVAVKDQIWTKGVRTTAGSSILKDFVPQEDATVIAKLKEAGAILLGKTSMTEFAMTWTHYYPFGIPRNPWDLDRMPGGSSGGSGSANAAFLCATALGEDTGGSIRNPASFCGIVGLRPSYGRVSRHGLLGASWSMDTIGPMSRTVADCAMTLQAIAGYDPKDPYTWNVPVPDYTKGLTNSLRNVKVGVVTQQMSNENLNPEIKTAVAKAIKVIGSLGASLQQVSLPLIRKMGPVYWTITMVEDAAAHRLYIRERLKEYDHNMQIHLLASSLFPAQAYYKAQRLREVWRRQALEALSKVDVLVYPTTATPATPVVDKPGIGSKEQIKVDLLDMVTYTGTANLAGGTPALSVPCGFTTSGLPIGLQIVGRPFDEATVLKVGHAYQQATDWHARRPPI